VHSSRLCRLRISCAVVNFLHLIQELQWSFILSGLYVPKTVRKPRIAYSYNKLWKATESPIKCMLLSCNLYLYFPCGAIAQLGRRPPHCRCFYITHK
jgi:hypothetical protein